MAKYIVDAGGSWRRYHPMKVPEGWRMLGTIRSASDHSAGALGCSPAGLYAQINVDSVRVLDQHAVAEALCRVELP